jgi:hypothetical protein
MFVLAKRISTQISVILQRYYQEDRRKVALFQYVFTLPDLSSIFYVKYLPSGITKKEITAPPSDNLIIHAEYCCGTDQM